MASRHGTRGPPAPRSRLRYAHPIEPTAAHTAFYVVADGPGYLPKAVTALQSIRRFHPEAGYFVLGRFGNDATLPISPAGRGIELAHLDLSGVFLPTRPTGRGQAGWPAWPSEAFWWSHGYTVLAARDYRYSCAVDGDTLCVAPLDLGSVFDGGAAISGVAKRNGRVNTGVLFFDHARLTDLGFAERSRQVYGGVRTCDHDGCGAGMCAGHGDQHLLAAIERVCGIVPRRIPNAYNHMLEWDRRPYRAKNPEAPFGIGESKILHLLLKPWRPRPALPFLNPVAVEGYHLWWDFVEALWPDRSERERQFGGRDRTVPASRALLRLIRRRVAQAAG